MKRVVLTVASVLASIAVLPLLLSAAGAPPPGKASQTNCYKAPFTYPERTSPNEPSRWVALSPCYEACGNGGEQSPVSLTGAVFTPGLPSLSFRYARNATVQVVNDTHTIKASTPGGGQFWIGTDVYELVEFHFHWLSEHRLGSAQTPLELHLVNKNAGGRTAAVGVFIERDPQNRDNPQLAKLWQRLADYHEEPIPVAGIDIQALVPTVHRSFRYAGSLTTPPCGQGLQWHVLATPIYASQAQITRFRTFFPTSNSRQPDQPLNGRRVLKDF
jgi:carbonic anhydrase